LSILPFVERGRVLAATNTTNQPIGQAWRVEEDPEAFLHPVEPPPYQPAYEPKKDYLLRRLAFRKLIRFKTFFIDYRKNLERRQLINSMLYEKSKERNNLLSEMRYFYLFAVVVVLSTKFTYFLFRLIRFSESHLRFAEPMWSSIVKAVSTHAPE
jgi:hypothetical protein